MRTFVSAAIASVAFSLHGAASPAQIRVPPGFRVETFARGLSQPTAMAYGPDGRIFVTESSGRIVAIARGTNRPALLARGLRTPLGLAWRGHARGLRNPYGLAFQPGTSRLFASVNGQDHLGTKADPEPAETVVDVRRHAFYGWPRCWPSARTLRLSGRCKGVTPPAAYLEPHGSADGIVFYTGRSFPRSYRGDLFVAEWGQYLSHRFGRRVVRVELRRDGRSSRLSSFASGFAHPLALLVDRRGGLLVADWGRGIVYRIQARNAP